MDPQSSMKYWFTGAFHFFNNLQGSGNECSNSTVWWLLVHLSIHHVYFPNYPLSIPGCYSISRTYHPSLSLKHRSLLVFFHFKSTFPPRFSAVVTPKMAPISEVQVENVVFPPSVKPPGSSNDLFLGGAGVRGLDIQGKFVKFTAIGVYLESSAVTTLSGEWKGKTAEELADSVDFYRDVVTGPFEKFTKVTMILPLTGKMYSEKVTENCVAIWKALGLYTDAEAEAIDKFTELFKDETFPPASSILFTHSPHGVLTISFSKDGCLPEVGNAVIENKLLTEGVLESIIGKHGVSPEAKKSLAARLSELFVEKDCEAAGDEKI